MQNKRTLSLDSVSGDIKLRQHQLYPSYNLIGAMSFLLTISSSNDVIAMYGRDSLFLSLASYFLTAALCIGTLLILDNRFITPYIHIRCGSIDVKNPFSRTMTFKVSSVDFYEVNSIRRWLFVPMYDRILVVEFNDEASSKKYYCKVYDPSHLIDKACTDNLIKAKVEVE